MNNYLIIIEECIIDTVSLRSGLGTICPGMEEAKAEVVGEDMAVVGEEEVAEEEGNVEAKGVGVTIAIHLIIVM